jgi:hypothetical protein
MDILHPDSFVETGDCSGPRRTRNQPSRETPGTLLQDKYVNEFGPIDFNEPFRNAIMFVKELKKQLALLDDAQQKTVLKLLYDNNAVEDNNVQQQGLVSQDQQQQEQDQRFKTSTLIIAIIGVMAVLGFLFYLSGGA